MKNLFIIILLSLFCFVTYSQNNNVSSNIQQDTNKQVFVAKMPEFNGKIGVTGFVEYVMSSIVYPPKALELGLEGVIIISFLVDTSGNLINAKIDRGVHEIVDNEILRVMNESPKWKPAISSKGKPVMISYKFPIAFTPYQKKQKKINKRIKKGKIDYSSSL